MHSEALNYLSIATGWVYFVAWSVSFYPQVYTNWRRKSVEGLSFEYLMHNITGHTFYCSFSVVMYLYAQPKYHLDEEVKMNDMAFGMHAVLLTLITIGQCLVYDRGGQTLSRPHMAVCALVWLGLGIDIILAAAGCCLISPLKAKPRLVCDLQAVPVGRRHPRPLAGVDVAAVPRGGQVLPVLHQVRPPGPAQPPATVHRGLEHRQHLAGHHGRHPLPGAELHRRVQ
eukprot:TRINITY_DN3332_c0_g1_i1.p1 TRINITY_DN3332_c0_g1~~TRINITY_DN3332_c0_g1_i1.p1  ORF type:complete len:227 (-),score=21.23 TRINITY_DN3332_c0_g1_i1:641-1321(-)